MSDDEIYIRYEALASLTERSDASSLEEYIDNRFNQNGGVSITLGHNIDGGYRSFKTLPNMKIGIIENHEDIYKSARYGGWSQYIVSPNVYKAIKAGRLCQYGIFMDDINKIRCPNFIEG